MSQTYYAILTAAGEAKLANAIALGTQLQISRMAVGDGNGVLPTPDRVQTALVREQYRADLNSLIPDPFNANQIIAEMVIPETEGGWWLREMGLYDPAGVLIAVSNCPPSYKPQMAEGSGRTQVLRMVLIVSSTAAVQLKIDPSVVLATREFVTITVNALLADSMPVMSGAASPGVATKAARSDHRHPTDTSRAPLASPAFTGAPTGPTPAAGDSSTKLATTEFVASQLSDAAPVMSGAASPGVATKAARSDHRHPTDTSRAPLASPAFTGTPTAPTPAAGDKSTKLATTEFVERAVTAKPINMQRFTVSGSFTAPVTGTYYISGCAGGGDGFNSSVACGGGSGGQCFDEPVELMAGEVVPVTIAAKGGTTTFGSYITMTGGQNGTATDGGAPGTGPINGQRGGYRSSSNIGGMGGASLFGFAGPQASSSEPRPNATGYGAGGGGHNGSPGFGGPGLISVRW
jgi:phage-related tail fiber protein